MSDTTPTVIRQSDRDTILSHPEARAFRKTARIIAILAIGPFVVETDRGPMRGDAGDWIATNHPQDDPGSDLWTISSERMANTYEPALRVVSEEPTITVRQHLDIALEQLREEQAAGGRDVRDRHRSVAITKLEEALLWLGASEVL